MIKLINIESFGVRSENIFLWLMCVLGWSRKLLPKTVKCVCVADYRHAMPWLSLPRWPRNLANLAVFKRYVFIKWNISHNVFSIELSWLPSKRKQAPKTFVDTCRHTRTHTRGYICNVSCPVISSHQYFVRFIISIDNIKYVRGVNCCWISTSVFRRRVSGRYGALDVKEGERYGRGRWGQKLVVMWHCSRWHATVCF